MFPTNPDKLNHFAPDKSIIAKNNECVGAWQIFIVQLRYNEKLRAKNCVRYIIDVRWKRKSVIKYSIFTVTMCVAIFYKRARHTIISTLCCL